MGAPVNFDSPALDGLLNEWLLSLRHWPVEAIVILGPNPFGGREARDVVAVHPPSVSEIAQALAQSNDFGSAWRDSDAPLVAWQHLVKSAPQDASAWRQSGRNQGFQTVVRIEFGLPAGRAFECFLFSPRELQDRTDPQALAWSTMSIWPMIKRTFSTARRALSPRELECLQLAFEGLTARQSAIQMLCSERTVNYHLANAMSKLKVDNKMAAIQRACWFGAL